jgi:4-hydroxy-2-oxoheptanedioate aldolase
MQENRLKTRLLQGKACYGVISPTTDPVVCEYIGLAGLDFHIMDGEHGAIGPAEAISMVRACEYAGITPMARVRSNDEKLILQFLDAGVMGVMMPGTNDVEDCHRLVAAVKYPPLGTRGLGPVRASDYMAGRMSQSEYIAYANAQTLVFPMIETPACLANLSRMAKVEGVDGFILGPRDLSLSMGYLDGPAHPEVERVIDEAIAIVTGAGKVFGTVAGNAEQAAKLRAKGVTLLLNSVQGLLTQSVKAFTKDRES